MAIDEFSQLIHLPIDNVPGAPPPKDTPDEETIDPQNPHLTCTFDHTMTTVHRQVVGVEYIENTGVSTFLLLIFVPFVLISINMEGLCK